MRQVKERLIHGFFILNGLLVVVLLAGIFLLLVFKAIPAFKEISLKDFFLSGLWNPTSMGKAAYGIFSMVVSTFLVTIGSLALAIPLGIGSAAFLSDVASPRTREIIKPIIEVLAVIPSVVIGFLGIVLVGPLLARTFGLANGLNALNGSILLAVMALPTIVSLSEDALNSVPQSFMEASLALGATRWQTLVSVKIPAAFSGILASCMLGMGRVIGETMTVLMATGNAAAMPHGMFDAVRTMTATIAIELGEVAYGSTHYYALFAVGFLLFVMTFMINLGADIFLHKVKRAAR